MRMYSVIFEKDGEAFAGFHTHASNEADAQAQCSAWFRDHPEYDPLAENPDLVIRVEVTRIPGKLP